MNRSATGPWRLALVLWIAGLAVSALIGSVWHTRNEAVSRARFDALTGEFAGRVAKQFELYQYGLRGARGAIVVGGGHGATRQQFERYIATRNTADEFPGARGFGYIQRVARDDEAAFVAAARADGMPEFSVRQLAPWDGERFIIKYIYPLEDNQGATGLDIASESNRREAALTAARTGQPRLTAPITLVQASGKTNQGFLLLMPIYRGLGTPATAEAREATAIGWSYAPLVVDEVLGNLGVRSDQIWLALTDVEDANRFFVSPDFDTGVNEQSQIQARRSLTVFGRTWQLEAHPQPQFFLANPVSDPRLVTGAMAAMATIAAATVFLLLQLRRKKLDAHIEQERFAASIVDAAPHGLLVVDEAGRIAQANLAAAEMFGYQPGDIVGLSVDELVPPDIRGDHGALRHAYDRTLRTMAPRRELSGWRRDGTSFKASIQLAPVDVGGRSYVIAGVSDISEQLAARQLLADSEQRWHELANSLPQLVWTCDASGACDFLSRQWIEYTGVPVEQQLGSGWLEQVHPDDRPGMMAAWSRSVETLEPYDVEFRIRRHDGTYRCFDTRAGALLDSEGRVSRWIGSNTDVENRHVAERQVRTLLEQMEARVVERTAEVEAVRRDLQNIVDAIPSMIGYWDRDLRNRFANKAYLNWFGVGPEALAGQHMRDLMGDTLFEANFPFVEAALRGEPQQFDRELVDCSGAHRYVQAHYLPDVRDQEVHGFYVLIFDVTELKRSELSLSAAKEAAEAATRAKSVFLTSMSHELRTPMNSVVGFSDLLLSQRFGAMNEKQLEFTRLVDASARHLLKLMDDVLELSKIEAGKTSMSLESVHVAPLIKSALATLQPMAASRNVTIREKHFGGTLAIRADSTRMMQALINIGSNAIKYNRAGGWVELSCVEMDGHLRVQVRDNGVGIPADRQAEIFQPFNRLGAEQGTIEGTGIGLTLTKALVEMMGGTIGFESEQGKGTAFWIDMPIDDQQRSRDSASSFTESPTQIPTIGSPIKVLYVEDNEQNRILFRNYVSLVPMVELIESSDGATALDIVRSRRPDVVFLDINLPGMDGYQILQGIKSDPGLRDTPVVALSANAMRSDIQRGLNAGFARYLSKPVALVDVIDATIALGNANAHAA